MIMVILDIHVFLLKKSFHLMKWRLWRRDVPREFIEEPVVLIVAKENGCGFSADAGLLLKANDIKFAWAGMKEWHFFLT